LNGPLPVYGNRDFDGELGLGDGEKNKRRAAKSFFAEQNIALLQGGLQPGFL
jgi:hypothetical protein